MTSHKAPVIGMALVAALLLISSLGAGVQAASWHTIQADAQNKEIIAPVFVWDGGGADDKASTAANWVGDIAPYEGVSIYFNATSSKACTWDLTITNERFIVYSEYNGTITLGASITTLYLDISGGTITQTNPYSYWLICGGYVNIESGTTAAHAINLRATGINSLYLDIPYANRLRNIDITGTYTNYGYIYMYGTLRVNGTLSLNGHIFNYYVSDIGIRGTGAVSSVSSYSYYLNSPSHATVTPVFEPTITGLNLVFSNNAGTSGTVTYELAGALSVLSISTPTTTTVSPVVIDMKGYSITTTNIYINKNATIKNTGAATALRGTIISISGSGATINGTNIRPYLNNAGTLTVPTGTSFPIVYMTNPGGTITNQVTVTDNYIMLSLGANAYYPIWINGLRWQAGTTDSIGRLYLTPGTLPAGTYQRQTGWSSPAWYSIQSDSQIGFTFAVTAWHIIQNDSKSLYFYPYDFHTIQADSVEYRIGQLVHAQYFNGTVKSSGSAPVIQPGTNTESNVMGIIWLLIFFIPAIILFAYLGKLGGTLGLVIMSVISVMAFDMGIFIMIVGIISSVIIMVESDGGD